MRITDEFGNTNDVTISGNYMIGAGFNFEVVSSEHCTYAITNVSVTNNYTGFAKVPANIIPAQPAKRP